MIFDKKNIMFNRLIYISLILLFSGCLGGNSHQKSTGNLSDENQLLVFCTCKNRNGLTIEEFSKLEMQKQNMSMEEFEATIAPWPNGWLLNEFVHDKTYVKAVIKGLKKHGAYYEEFPVKNHKKLMRDIEDEYPVCSKASIEILPLIM